MSYDPWQFATTKNGYHADEVISALQKCIRRGLEEEASMFAYELYLTSPGYPPASHPDAQSPSGPAWKIW